MDLALYLRLESLPFYAFGVLALVLVTHLVWYILDVHHLRDIPGPFFAKLTDLWLFRLAVSKERTSPVIYRLHEIYGPLVRVAPNHVSISKPEALNAVYGHSSGTLKTDFYKVFQAIGSSVFSTLDRAEHTRKRKIHANGFSQRVLLEYEPFIRDILHQLVFQFDRMCKEGMKGGRGNEGEHGWFGQGDRVWTDITGWMHYFTFDVISSLAFGGAFGMVESGKGVAKAVKPPKDGAVIISADHTSIDMEEVPIVAAALERPRASMMLAHLPTWMRSLAMATVLRVKDRKALFTTVRTASAAVENRMTKPTDRKDLLSNLLEATDDQGNKLSPKEILAEALTLLVAGSDTTSNSAAVTMYYVARDSHVQTTLQTELDKVFAASMDAVPTHEEVSHLPYLEATITEGLRLASTVTIGLPRVVPEGGLTVLDKHFKAGTVLSVPNYCVHRNAEAFGPDVDVFRPERWLVSDERTRQMQKSMNAFSIGPRACIGRHLAMIELRLLLSTILRRYSFVLKNPDAPLEMQEAILAQPLDIWVGMKKRDQ